MDAPEVLAHIIVAYQRECPEDAVHGDDVEAAVVEPGIGLDAEAEWENEDPEGVVREYGRRDQKTDRKEEKRYEVKKASRSWDDVEGEVIVEGCAFRETWQRECHGSPAEECDGTSSNVTPKIDEMKREYGEPHVIGLQIMPRRNDVDDIALKSSCDARSERSNDEKSKASKPWAKWPSPTMYGEYSIINSVH